MVTTSMSPRVVWLVWQSTTASRVHSNKCNRIDVAAATVTTRVCVLPGTLKTLGRYATALRHGEGAAMQVHVAILTFWGFPHIFLKSAASCSIPWPWR